MQLDPWELGGRRDPWELGGRRSRAGSGVAIGAVAVVPDRNIGNDVPPMGSVSAGVRSKRKESDTSSPRSRLPTHAASLRKGSWVSSSAVITTSSSRESTFGSRKSTTSSSRGSAVWANAAHRGNATLTSTHRLVRASAGVYEAQVAVPE